MTFPKPALKPDPVGSPDEPPFWRRKAM